MKRWLLTSCAMGVLTATAFAQTPPANAPTDRTQDRPAAAQPAQPATKPDANKAAGQNQSPSAPQAQSGSEPRADQKAPARTTAAKPQGEVKVVFYAVKPADIRASSLIGSTVYNVNNENVGEIQDVIIGNGQTLQAVVIGVGGFLGLGEHTVAVEPGSLTIMPNSDDPDEFKVVLNSTKDDLKNAPAVKFDKDSRQQAARNGASPQSGTTGAADNGAAGGAAGSNGGANAKSGQTPANAPGQGSGNAPSKQ